MGINRFNVYGSGSATATDLRLDASRRQLGQKIKMLSVSGRADISSTTKWTTVAFDSPRIFDAVGITEIQSTSVLDVTQNWFIEGIDFDSGLLVSEFVTMTGTTPVTLANKYSIVNVCQQYSGVQNKGSIQFLTSSAVTQALEIASGNLQAGIIGIPVGHTAILDGLTMSTNGTNTEVEIALAWSQDGAVVNHLMTWDIKTFSQMPSWMSVSETFCSPYRGGAVSPTKGGFFSLQARAITGTSTVNFVANTLITKVETE